MKPSLGHADRRFEEWLKERFPAMFLDWDSERRRWMVRQRIPAPPFIINVLVVQGVDGEYCSPGEIGNYLMSYLHRADARNYASFESYFRKVYMERLEEQRRRRKVELKNTVVDSLEYHKKAMARAIDGFDSSKAGIFAVKPGE